MENYIVGLGETLFDCLPDGKKLGGAPANFAYHVSQFGSTVWRSLPLAMTKMAVKSFANSMPTA